VPSGNNGFYFVGRRKFANAREDVVNAIRREHGEELRVTKSEGKAFREQRFKKNRFKKQRFNIRCR
jgi:hypothetical protein